ncbi:MAG TPA: YceI family protein [Cyclobacteriaceae bacterium]|nr:YceI family protein [Cyclobacteriaceae bacterium]
MIRLAILLILVFCISCKRQSKTELSKSDSKEAAASYSPVRLGAHEKYTIDEKQSVIVWKGSMVLATKGGHTGYISVSNGELLIENSRLVGGVVQVDMNTITDERHDTENELVRHLKSPDFFDAKIFPITTFQITKVAPADGGNMTVTGDLTIKGITHAVAFPARMDIKNGVANAKGKLTIDRTQWDVRYNSGKFFLNLADEAISDSIEFDVQIVAKKNG